MCRRANQEFRCCICLQTHAKQGWRETNQHPRSELGTARMSESSLRRYISCYFSFHGSVVKLLNSVLKMTSSRLRFRDAFQLPSLRWRKRLRPKD
ncbi:hypothetical protein AAFF_G00173530 [Aldrovandia affinis]|uniref:Uncharacterized protein n=1 Tax=Aldrovandia affinis TaxID=143900 RepID=A0AAD7SYX5_9TELE|nr:hypothetical protein AAFF_G00173530 [Aldrovandia affinis]